MVIIQLLIKYLDEEKLDYYYYLSLFLSNNLFE